MTSLQKWGKSVRTTIPVMAGYLVLGAGFGILLRTRGYGLGWALAMSAFIYAGSMQYVAIDLLTGGASLLTTAVTTLLVNARHLFYGISMLERYRAAGKYAPYLIFSLTDETYSLVAAREDLTGAECFRISLLDQLYWVLGTALGSLVGAYLDFNTTGKVHIPPAVHHEHAHDRARQELSEPQYHGGRLPSAAEHEKRRKADERRDERGDRNEQNGVRIHTLSPPFFVRRASSTRRQQSMPPIVGSRKLSAPNRRRQTIETPRPMSAGA